mgnify:CR=1 FL=1
MCYADTPEGQNREHAIFGASRCVAVSPSDTATAITALEGSLVLRGPGGERDKQGPNGSEDHPVTSSAEPPDFPKGSVTYYVTLDFEYFLRKT